MCAVAAAVCAKGQSSATEAHLESITSSTSHLVVKVILNGATDEKASGLTSTVKSRDRVELNMESQKSVELNSRGEATMVELLLK